MEKRNRRGATLMELLVVIALIALVSGVVGPAIAARLDNFSLRRTATELAAQFRKAQALARAEQVPVIMTYAGREFRFLKESKRIAGLELPSSISPSSTDVGTYVFLPSGQIVAPGVLELRNSRGRIVRLETDPLAGVVITPGGSS